VPGSPPIVETIFRKVDTAAIFVADLTFVGKRLGGNPTPNPNVLIEYGWALKRLGYGRIIAVMNVAFGDPKEKSLPFDLAHLRHPLQYFCASGADADSRRKSRSVLAKELQVAIKAVVESAEFKQSLPKPVPPPRFHALEPRNGRGRFRASGQALGANARLRMSGVAKPDIFLVEGGAVWLRVMPEFEPKRTWQVTDRIKVAESMPTKFMPILQASGQYGRIRSGDGFGIYGVKVEDGRALDVVFAFTTGEVWSIDAWQIPTMGQNNPRILSLDEEDFNRPFRHYVDFLSEIGVRSPYRWKAGIEDTMNRHFRGRRNELHDGVCLVDFIEEEGIYTPGDDPNRALIPFFSKIYDSCGLRRPRNSDE
jgi:hypothetical protein